MSTAPSPDATTDVPDKQIEEIFRNTWKLIHRTAYRYTSSWEDAENVLQTIFVRLTPGWSNRDLSPNPRAFLYRAAINASLDVVRLRKRANAVSLDVVDFEQSSQASSPADNLADTELRELVRQAVAKLEGRTATAFILRYYEGYDNRRIAELNRRNLLARYPTPAVEALLPQYRSFIDAENRWIPWFWSEHGIAYTRCSCRR